MDYRLREVEPKDCNGMLEWMHDPQINRLYTNKIRMATKESVEKFIADAASARASGSAYHYAIVNNQDEYMGTISLKNIDDARGAEFAISMRRQFQGHGIASRATKEMLGIAFQELGLNRIYLYVLSDNEHANHFYVKNKFRYEGEFKQCILIGNERKSLTWYAMLAEEYRNNIAGNTDEHSN